MARPPGPGCAGCAGGTRFPIEIGMAFQPIVDIETRTVFAYEALVRGPAGETSGWVLERVTDELRYAFDQRCRITAIREAARLRLPESGAMLSINFLPNAVYEPEHCLRATLRTAEATGFPLDRLMFEVTEGERVDRPDHLRRIIDAYKRMGFTVAIDDFGAGYAGLGLLSEFRPDIVKLDMHLVRGIAADGARRAIIRGVMGICAELGLRVIAEGVETREEGAALRALGLRLFQGYLFAPPALGRLPDPAFP